MTTQGDYTNNFLLESISIIQSLDQGEIEAVAHTLATTRSQGGRLFFAGSGGGAGHASHATADFRKMGGFEAYSVSDNVSELTARVNDDSWADAYSHWLRCSRIGPADCLFIFSVGGGNEERQISVNLVNAIREADAGGAAIVGIVGRDGGFLRATATASILIPTVNPSNTTTQVEGFQALLWHLIVGHPMVNSQMPKWESTEPLAGQSQSSSSPTIQ